MNFAKDPKDEVVELHYLVIRVANFFLGQVSDYTITELSEHNKPTYDKVAIDARVIAGALRAIAENGVYSEDRLAENAQQAALYMEMMAIAIRKKQQEELDRAASDLKKMCQF